MRDVVTNIFKSPFQFARHKVKQVLNQNTNEDYWALKDLDFSVKKGEVVGVIGPNGAGKSTLLKVLSRITPPTEGEVRLRGKVSSLLEVGTGFHPELTGRENIYLNGAILGMTQKEIDTKFDDIVEFSGVEKFIDTPIKRYSSGMQVRLAFSVAAHLDPDILLVDEVLAVGDAEFQKKCLGKMEAVSKQGRTVIFVSHNMAAISRLCQRVIVLKEGRIVIDSDTASAIKHYLSAITDIAAEKTWESEKAPGDEFAKLKAVRVLNKKGEISDIHDIRDSIVIEMDYWVLQANSSPTSVVSFLNDQEVVLFVSPEPMRKKKKGLYTSRCKIPGNMFAEGQITIAAEISSSEPYYQKHVLEHDVISFQVMDKGEPGSVRYGWPKLAGLVRPMMEWNTKKVTDYK